MTAQSSQAEAIMPKSSIPPREALIAIMGATGTGKSTFINHLTNDENIRIGHGPESETTDIVVSSYFDKAGSKINLVDTPGFDDSRGLSDVNILERIVQFLQEDGGRKLNGLIYMHRISDPRLGGISKKNLRLFRQLCGDDKLRNVIIVTTNWGRVGKQEGRDREEALATGGFKALIDAGARLARHDKGYESALSIISQLVDNDAITTQLQEELNSGKTLAATSAGAIITEELEEFKKIHKKEMEDLKLAMVEASKEKNEALKAELAEERRELNKKMAQAEADREILKQTLQEQRRQWNSELRAMRDEAQRACDAAPRYISWRPPCGNPYCRDPNCVKPNYSDYYGGYNSGYNSYRVPQKGQPRQRRGNQCAIQ